MDTYLAIYAHISIAYLHFLLAFRIFPKRNSDYSTFIFWLMMGTYALLHSLYGISYVMYLFDFQFAYTVFVLLSHWLLAFLPPLFFPIVIGELTATPVHQNGLTRSMLFVTRNAKQFFYAALVISLLIVFASIPDQFPLSEWDANAGNVLALYMVLSLGAFWLFLLLIGLRPAPTEWGALARPVRFLFAGLLLLYLATGWSNIGEYWSLIPIISTLSFSLVFSWYRFRLQFMDIVLNRCFGLLLLFIIVTGFAKITTIPLVRDDLSSGLFFYTLYILLAVFVYQSANNWTQRLWRPSNKQLAVIHSDLPKRLATTMDVGTAQKYTADFLSVLFECDVTINSNEEPANTSVELIGDPAIRFELGYIRGWIPWLSEALGWVQTAGLYLQSHLLILDSLERLRQQNVRTEELSTLAARAELNAMRARIRPHFLFNTLNSIHSFVQDDPEQAEQVIELLADLMRGVLMSSEQDVIPLRQELDLVDTYLQIEKARYGDRLSFEILQGSSYHGVTIPPFTIQPLVENAVKHAVDSQLEPVHIQIALVSTNDRLVIDVIDNGPGLSTSESKGIGLAVQNIQQRLDRLYNGKAMLQVLNNEIHGVCSRLEIPMEEPSVNNG